MPISGAADTIMGMDNKSLKVQDRVDAYRLEFGLISQTDAEAPKILIIQLQRRYKHPL